MLYTATHTTRYRYDAPVSQCQSEVRLTPRTLPWQTVIESHIETTPAPASVESRRDYFGNEVSTFTILESHDRFSTVATSVVDVEARPESTAIPETAWEEVRDEIARHRTPQTLEAFEFVFDSPFVAAGPELADYARPSFEAESAAGARRSTTCPTGSTRSCATRPKPHVSTRRCSRRCGPRGACARTSPTS